MTSPGPNTSSTNHGWVLGCQGSTEGKAGCREPLLGCPPIWGSSTEGTDSLFSLRELRKYLPFNVCNIGRYLICTPLHFCVRFQLQIILLLRVYGHHDVVCCNILNRFSLFVFIEHDSSPYVKHPKQVLPDMCSPLSRWLSSSSIGLCDWFQHTT